MSNILLGTCSWNYASWVGLVYSCPQKTAADYLIEYSKHFTTAEIDSWFYKIPTKAETKRYGEQTPDNFTFTCKVVHDITQPFARAFNQARPSERNPSFLSYDLFARYCDGIEPLLGKIALIMFEFEYLNQEKMASVQQFMDVFGEFRTKIDKQYRIGIEIRNKNYLTDAYFKFLHDQDIVHVFSEKQYMPHVYEVYQKYRNYIGNFAVIRLLGEDRAAIEQKTQETWNAIVEEKPDKEQIATMAMDIAHAGGKVIININNHYEGSAPLTVEYFRSMFRSQGIEIQETPVQQDLWGELFH
jgi:uncharacterized protein YecE (DUF72 family)